MILSTEKPFVSGMSSSANQQIPSEVATTSTAMDVHCGTGNEIANHPGNVLFVRVVLKYVGQYALAGYSRKKKMMVSKAALDELTNSGVRFLKKHPVLQHWYVASQKVGKAKIGRFLRHHLPRAAISGSDKIRPTGTTFRPALLPSVRPKITSPLSRFLLRETAHGHPENIKSVWNKLADLRGTSLLLGAQSSSPETLLTKTDSFSSVPFSSQVPGGGDLISLRLSGSIHDDDDSSGSYHDLSKDDFFDDYELAQCFSESFCMHHDDNDSSSGSHISRDDLFDDIELAQCLDWQVS